MKKLLLPFLLFVCLQSFCQTVNYWQQQTNYRISVTLNDVAKTVSGTCSIDYYNNSPDTLRYIWFHLWPNAYKNDKTAFSEQLLQNGRTDFYFSNPDDRGYINRLNFLVNGIHANTEDHPEHQDILKLILPEPLAYLERIFFVSAPGINLRQFYIEWRFYFGHLSRYASGIPSQLYTTVKDGTLFHI